MLLVNHEFIYKSEVIDVHRYFRIIYLLDRQDHIVVQRSEFGCIFSGQNLLPIALGILDLYHFCSEFLYPGDHRDQAVGPCRRQVLLQADLADETEIIFGYFFRIPS